MKEEKIEKDIENLKKALIQVAQCLAQIKEDDGFKPYFQLPEYFDSLFNK